MRNRLIRILAAAAAAITTPASAAWHQAQSKHFVIYADENPRELAEFANRLERFDLAVRRNRAMDDPAIGDGNRVTVFVLPSVAAVERLMGDRTGFVLGYYKPRASGPLAFVPRSTGARTPWALDAETVFFHEYAHHLMMQVLDKPYPQWLVEGFAEFLSTAEFHKDGSVDLGLPAVHRARALRSARGLPLEAIIGATYAKIDQEERSSIYARGWLLLHYLVFEPSRDGQLGRYTDAIARGTPALTAAQTAFGDLKQLDRDLDAYLGRHRLSAVRVSGSEIRPGPIDVRPLSEGASRIILLRARTKSGVRRVDAEAHAVEVRKVQARYPGDELVETTLAEAELDAGHAEAAEAAADRAIKVNARNTEAQVLKGRAIVARAKTAGGNAHPLFEQARRLFIAANKLDTEDPEPLMEYYKSYLAEGLAPTPNAVAALHYASDLAPQDRALRLNSAVRYVVDGKLAEARRALAPIAYDPHNGRIAAIARQMMARLDAGDTRGALGANREASKD